MAGTVIFEVLGSVAYPNRDFMELERATVRRLQKLFSVRVVSAKHPSVMSGQWDGKESLFRHYGDAMGFPTGLLFDAKVDLEAQGWTVHIVDRRPPAPKFKTPVRFIGEELEGDDYRKLRDYQNDAVVAATEGVDPFLGNGVLGMPIRSGKTLTSAKIIEALQTPTLFIAPGKSLMGQAFDVFEKYLEGASIGMIGDGKWTEGDVTVATIQTLMRRPLEAKRLINRCGLLITDEAHHWGSSPAWRATILKAQTRYKIGLTGTPPVIGANEVSDEAAVWMRACTGPLLYKISMQRLIREGVLKSPIILFYPIISSDKKIDLGEVSPQSRWGKLYKLGILDNENRNRAIVQLASQAADLGLRTIIDVGKVEQIDNISRILTDLGRHHEVSHGKHSLERRKATNARIARGETQIVVGTIFGEGVDIPELEVVINGEGLGSPDGQARTASIQRLRNLTACRGKGQAIVIDFIDHFSPTLEEHSYNRLGIYKSVRGFDVREIHWGPGMPYRIPTEVVGLIQAKEVENVAQA